MRIIKRFIRILVVLVAIKKLFKPDQNGEINYYKIGPQVNKQLSELGPTFIKLGQMLSMRADLIPTILADQFRQLLDHGVEADFSQVEDVFLSEIGKYPKEVFENFSEKPLAVASLSQVHQATFQGRKLAVKIQKPHIKHLIMEDLRICRWILAVTKKFIIKQSTRDFLEMGENAVEEFFSWIEHELDYRLEALNLARIKEHFTKEKYFLAPDVLHEFSSRRVLSMSYIEGVSFNELFSEVPNLAEVKVIQCRNVRIGKKVFINRALKVIYKQLFIDGYFHGDPHPANILITPDNQIAFIDFGVVGMLPAGLKKHIVEAVAGIVARDADQIMHGLLAMNESKKDVDLERVHGDIQELLNRWNSGSVLEMSMAEVFYRLLGVAQKHEVKIPLPMFIVGKTLLEYDGVLSKFDPEIDIIQLLKPMVEKDLAGDSNFIDKIIPEKLSDWANSLTELPLELEKLIKKVTAEGIEVSVRFGPKGAKNS